MKIYLAGPDVFRKDALEHAEKLKRECREFGFEGLFPLDNEIEAASDPRKTAYRIYKANMAMIHEADVVLANLDPFRGPSVDPGTAFEIGAGDALGKLVVGYYAETEPSIYKGRILPTFDVFTKAYPEIEDFNLFDNLMIEYGCSFILPSFRDALLQIEAETK